MLAVQRVSVLAILAISSFGSLAAALAQSSQFGGPEQDFKVNCKNLAYTWPKEGPPVLWSKDLGEGYSAILADGESLYTTYREGDEDHVVALNRKDGATQWDFTHESPVHEKHVKEFNAAPRSTPALADGRLYSISCGAILHCLDAKTGKKLWRKDLWKDFEKATFLNHGYSASPYVHGDTLIVLVGGKGHGVVAFDRETGDVKWQKHDFDASYATPKLIDLGGQKQLLCFMAKELIAINPDTGELYWQYAHGNPFGQNITMPVWGDDDIVVISSIEQGGTRALKLTRKNGATDVEELWHNRRIRIHHQNAIRIGDYVYASTGDPDVWQAINVRTGEVAWRERGFAKSNAIYADGEFIIIDEDGHIGLATACPDFFEVRAKVALLGPRAWTVPTLVGTTLYVRDNAKLVALDVGAKS